MIVFRADAGPKIGVGHVMRCLSIADGFTCNKENIIFISADRNAEALIKSRGYKNIILESDALHPENEIGIFKSIGAYSEAELIIFDGYYFSKEYIGGFSREKTTVYMDDLVAEAMPANVIINYNLFADKLEYEKLYENCPSGPILILGTDYVPLRKEFSVFNPIKISDRVENVLVLTGGADPVHVAPELAKSVVSRGIKNIRFHFVCGALSDVADELKKYQNDNIIVHLDVKDMKTLMCSCDMAISAAGSTLYELCACGVPTINYSIADNQRLAADEFAARGIMYTMGVVKDPKAFCIDVLNVVDKLSKDFKMRSEMSVKARTLVDGNGAKRLASRLEELIHK